MPTYAGFPYTAPVDVKITFFTPARCAPSIMLMVPITLTLAIDFTWNGTPLLLKAVAR